MSRPLPAGRSYTKNKDPRKLGEWGIDNDFKEKIQWAASKFIAGNSLGSIAKKIGISHSNLRNIFLNKSGDTYIQRLCNSKFNIAAKIKTSIPRLLDDDVIEKIKKRFEQNKTIGHGQSKNKYLLGRMVLCDDCRLAFVGSTHRKTKKQYYRHSKEGCPILKYKSLAADPLEKIVLVHLFEFFGDVHAIENAINAAQGDAGNIKELNKQKKILKKRLFTIKTKKNQLLDMIEQGGIEPKDVKSRMTEYNKIEDSLNTEISQINERLATSHLRLKLNKVHKECLGSVVNILKVLNIY